ncbi:MAG: epoxide hydrolase family protein [Dehalococcoidia bacterium]
MSEQAVRPFTIDVPDRVLEDLRDRLRRAHWPGEIDGGGWTYGTNLASMKELVRYWLEEYDWRAREAALNRLPQFIATVDGLDIHFVRVKGNGPNPLPLIISHGWPGSFVEMVEVIGPLADPAAYGGDPTDAFDVVVPSLPGYGFSQHSHQPGMAPRRIAGIFVRLMTDVLGYQRFAAQGGDWGSIITAAMARDYPERLTGIHLNMLAVRPTIGPDSPPLTEEEQAYLQRVQSGRDEETGYQRIQGTRPQTLSYGLTDSPVGLAAWIVEKFRAWSDCHGDLESSFTKDQLLTNIMIYWITGSIGTSVQLYYEAFHDPSMRLAPGERIEVPTGFAAFPGELFDANRAWAERAINIQHWSTPAQGGHFAAMEEPELFVEDVRAFFRTVRG